MKSVLLTGGTGFIGRHTLLPLIEKNFTVHAVYSSTKLIEHPQITWHQLNLHDTQAVDHLFQTISPSHLLHLAWYTKPEEYWSSLLNIDWLTSSLHLLNQFIKKGGKRVVLAGTCAEYDWQHGHCQEFLTPCVPSTIYGKTKHCLHLLSEAIASQQQVSLAWGRLFYLFGKHEYPTRLIPSAITSLKAKKKFEVLNGGQIRDFMYATDAANALVTLLNSSLVGPINIASGKPITIQDLISLIAHKLEKSDFVSYRDRTSMQEDKVTADVSRLSTEINWQPHYSLEAGLDETIAWWSERI